MNNSEPTANNLLYLIDGTAFAYRAHYARMTLTNSKGDPTDAIYGFANTLLRIVRVHAPDFIAVVFDAKGKTFRDEVFPQYKANRKPMPDDLRLQFPYIQELVEALGIKSFTIEGVEADDVIGTLSVAANRVGWNIVIASNDKDLAQLVNETTILRDEHNSVNLGPAQVRKKFGVKPAQIVDYLALVGDTSDNIPGVRLVGPKTAAKWLNHYGSIDNLMQNAHEIKGKAGQNLRNSREQLELSRHLVQLKLDINLGCELDDLKMVQPNKKKLLEIYSHLESKSLLKTLDDLDETEDRAQTNYQTVIDQQSFEKLIEKLRDCKEFALDTETTGLDLNLATLVGISISFKENEAYYIPLKHNYLEVPEQLDTSYVISGLRPIFENEEISKILQNFKFDANVLAKHGVEIRGKVYDTMIESYVFNSTAVNRHSLDSLALKYLEHETMSYEDIAGKGKKQKTFDKIDIGQATFYAAEDADVTFRLHHSLWPRIQSTETVKQVFETIEMPLVSVLDRMEKHGVLINRNELHRQSADLKSRMDQIEGIIYDEAGTKFNLASPKQIREVLFDKLQLPSMKKTATGVPSTSESVLRELSNRYFVPKLILEHRHLAKLKSTYTDKLGELINPDTGRVHTSYQQTVAATGRLSSTNPNLQNIPIRTPEGQRIREAFTADTDHVLVSLDYSQIELRLMAHLSGDLRLVESFTTDDDVHKITAAEVFGVEIDEVTSDQRRYAKGINFGLMYGMSAYGLSRQLEIEVEQAKDYIDQYFARYPGVELFMNHTKKFAREKRYVETIYGRRLYINEINSRNYATRQRAERVAINAPLQGSAADIVKVAMIEVDRCLTESKSKAKMILQVHDELLFEIPIEEQEEVTEQVKIIMENVIQLSVPLVANVGFGKNWVAAH